MAYLHLNIIDTPFLQYRATSRCSHGKWITRNMIKRLQSLIEPQNPKLQSWKIPTRRDSNPSHPAWAPSRLTTRPWYFIIYVPILYVLKFYTEMQVLDGIGKYYIYCFLHTRIRWYLEVYLLALYKFFRRAEVSCVCG